MFRNFIGHEDAVATIARSVAEGRAAHAYLITGPAAIGRRTLALAIARALNCLAPVADRPCEICRPCRLIARGVHPDVRLVKRAPSRRAILLRASASSTPSSESYADNVEFIQSDAQLRPADARVKVYVILNAEDLLPEAANRLLKVVEEPTQFVHFILTASDRGAVLPTIVSRCQEIRLRPVTRAQLAAALQARSGIAEDEAARLAALAGGRPGWALAAASDHGLLERHLEAIDGLTGALTAGRLDRLRLSRRLSDRWTAHPDAVREALRAWLTWIRDLLLTQAGLHAHRQHTEQRERDQLDSIARQLSTDQVCDAQRRVQQTLSDLAANVNPRLALDLLLLRLPPVAR